MTTNSTLDELAELIHDTAVETYSSVDDKAALLIAEAVLAKFCINVHVWSDSGLDPIMCIHCWQQRGVNDGE